MNLGGASPVHSLIVYITHRLTQMSCSESVIWSTFIAMTLGSGSRIKTSRRAPQLCVWMVGSAILFWVNMVIFLIIFTELRSVVDYEYLRNLFLVETILYHLSHKWRGRRTRQKCLGLYFSRDTSVSVNDIRSWMDSTTLCGHASPGFSILIMIFSYLVRYEFCPKMNYSSSLLCRWWLPAWTTNIFVEWMTVVFTPRWLWYYSSGTVLPGGGVINGWSPRHSAPFGSGRRTRDVSASFDCHFQKSRCERRKAIPYELPILSLSTGAPGPVNLLSRCKSWILL